MKKTKIKICGVTSTEEVSLLNELNVDFAGMVLFFPKSKRNISCETARLLINALDSKIKSVAVVVTPTLEQIEELADIGFDYIQIHGTISTDLIKKIPLPILKAFNVTDLSELEKYQSSSHIAGYVFDALTPGSGQTFDWALAPKLPDDSKFCLLAGGLCPENVAEAIHTLHPDGVDVSSGVEYTDRNGKDPAKVRAFVNQVRMC